MTIPTAPRPEELLMKQQKFMLLVSKLITFVYDKPGYGLTGAELYRTPAQAAWNAAAGVGIANSLHASRLAIQ